MDYSNSCMALQAICSSVQSLLGPNKSLKCYISQSSDSSEPGLLGDTMQVLDALLAAMPDSNSHHPIAELLYESCHEQQTEVGCGVTTLVCLSAYWATEIWRLLNEGMPLPIVFAIFDEALEYCESFFYTLSSKISFTCSQHTRTLQDGQMHSPVPQDNRIRSSVLQDYKTHSSDPRDDHTCSSLLQDNRIHSSVLQENHTCSSVLQDNRTHSSVLGNITKREGEADTRKRPPRYSSSQRQRQAKVLSFSRHFSAATSDRVVCGDSNGIGTGVGGQEERDLDGRRQPNGSYDLLQRISCCCLAHGRDSAMQLAVDTYWKHCSNTHTAGELSHKVNQKLLLHSCIVGRHQDFSAVLSGVVAQLHQDMLSVADQLKRSTKPLRVVVLEDDCSPSYAHIGLQKQPGRVMSHDISQLYAPSDKTLWLEQCLTVLKQFQVNVVIVGGVVSPSLWEQCLAMSILVLKGLGRCELDAVCKLSGATPLHYLKYCSEGHIGHSVALDVVESGWARPRAVFTQGQTERHAVKIYNLRMLSTSHTAPVVTTTILCGLTQSSVNILQSQFNNCLHRLYSAFNKAWSTPGVSGGGVKVGGVLLGLLLPGGGRTEVACVHMLEKRASEENPECCTDIKRLPHALSSSSSSNWLADIRLLTMSNWRPSVYRACANGLRRYATTVLMNSNPGEGTCEALTEVEKMVVKGLNITVIELMKKDCEVSERSEIKGHDNKLRSEFKVLDTAYSKREAWHRALSLLKVVFLSTKIDGT